MLGTKSSQSRGVPLPCCLYSHPHLIRQVSSCQSTQLLPPLISADLWPAGHWRLIAVWLEGHLSATLGPPLIGAHLAKLSLASGGSWLSPHRCAVRVSFCPVWFACCYYIDCDGVRHEIRRTSIVFVIGNYIWCTVESFCFQIWIL